MAEIGLVASVIAVASFGTAVASNLYKAADIMIHANQQILALAKHVNQFTGVLRHLGQMLETGNANFSKEFIRDIRKIKHSCKRTLKEVNASIKSKQFRHFVPVRWLFKRTKALELESRLDSQQSMLQCAIQTLTVSRLGQMDSRSREASEDLKVEINAFKTFIMEHYNNVAQLRRAEDQMGLEARYHPDPQYDLAEMPPSAPSDFSKNAYKDSSSDDEVNDEDAEKDKGEYEYNDDTARAKDSDPNFDGAISTYSSRHPLPHCDSPPAVNHRESSLLLQLIPYKPFSNQKMSDRLLANGMAPDGLEKHTAPGATNSIKLLLDKWTVSGSAPVTGILEEESEKDKEEAERSAKRRASASRSNRYEQSPPWTPTFGDGEYHPYNREAYYDTPYFQDYRDQPPPTKDRYQGRTAPRQSGKEFWIANSPYPHAPDQHFGGELLDALRSTRGGIFYSKSNHFQQVFFIDNYPIYTCRFVPPHMIPQSESMPLFTGLGKGLVRKEALDLLGYSYTESENGIFSIVQDLTLNHIEELVKLSYQALDKNLTARSKEIVKARGLKEAVDGMIPASTGTYGHGRSRPPPNPQHIPPPRPTPREYEDYSYRGRPRPYDDYENGHYPYVDERALSPLSREQRTHQDRALMPDMANTLRRPPTHSRRQDESNAEKKSTDVRFTLPHRQVTNHEVGDDTKERPIRTHIDVAPTLEMRESELSELQTRLEKLKARCEGAEFYRDIVTASDLKYYAIPDLEMRLRDLQDQIQKSEEEKTKKEKTTSTKVKVPGKHGGQRIKEEKALQSKVETESESSDNDDDEDGESMEGGDND